MSADMDICLPAGVVCASEPCPGRSWIKTKLKGGQEVWRYTQQRPRITVANQNDASVMRGTPFAMGPASIDGKANKAKVGDPTSEFEQYSRSEWLRFRARLVATAAWASAMDGDNSIFYNDLHDGQHETVQLEVRPHGPAPPHPTPAAESGRCSR